MKRFWMLAIVLSGLLQSYSCKENSGNKVLTKEVVFSKEGSLELIKASNDSILATLEIEFAESEYETQTGLMYRKSMQQNRGMLFVFDRETPKSFYMKNTEFPLDIIYVDKNKEIVSIVKNAKPLDQTSLPSEAPAMYVLEVNAGLSEQWGLEAGDRISFERE